jgi:hypothetical protein
MSEEKKNGIESGAAIRRADTKEQKKKIISGSAIAVPKEIGGRGTVKRISIQRQVAISIKDKAGNKTPVTTTMVFIDMSCPGCGFDLTAMYPGVTKCNRCQKYVVFAPYNNLEADILRCTTDQIPAMVKEFDKKEDEAELSYDGIKLD